MSHFSVLTDVSLPANVFSALLDLISFQKPPASLADKPEVLAAMTDDMKELFLTHQAAKGCLEEVVERLVDARLDPFYESPDKAGCLEFHDMTQEGQKQYESQGVDCVRMPDGSVVPTYDDRFSRLYELHEGKVYKRCYGPLHHRKRTEKAKRIRFLPGYPFKKRFPSYKAFMEEYMGYSFDEQKGAYGYWNNPDAKWDWYQIGGRWPLRFLVKNDCALAVRSEGSFQPDNAPGENGPDGYIWVAGARKCDIAWDVMTETLRKAEEQHFHQYESWCASGTIPKEAWSYKITEEGIACWGDLEYRRGESLDDYMERHGLSDEFKHPISTFAYLSDAGWAGSGDMGWFGIHYNDKDPLVWNRMVEEYISNLPDDAFLVSVDCHI